MEFDEIADVGNLLVVTKELNATFQINNEGGLTPARKWKLNQIIED